MKSKQEQFIKRRLPKLLKNTICNAQLLAILVSKGTITEEESNEIHIEPIDLRSNKLYSILFTRQDGFECIRFALQKTLQSKAASILNQYDNVYFKKIQGVWCEQTGQIGQGRFNTKDYIDTVNCTRFHSDSHNNRGISLVSNLQLKQTEDNFPGSIFRFDHGKWGCTENDEKIAYEGKSEFVQRVDNYKPETFLHSMGASYEIRDLKVNHPVDSLSLQDPYLPKCKDTHGNPSQQQKFMQRPIEDLKYPAIQLSDSEFFNLDEIFDDVQKIRGGNSSFQNGQHQKPSENVASNDDELINYYFNQVKKNMELDFLRLTKPYGIVWTKDA